LTVLIGYAVGDLRIGMQGLLVLSMGMHSQESFEFSAGRIKQALLYVVDAATDHWSGVVGDGLADQLYSRLVSEFWGLIDVTDDLAAEQPKVVAVHVARLA